MEKHGHERVLSRRQVLIGAAATLLSATAAACGNTPTSTAAPTGAPSSAGAPRVLPGSPDPNKIDDVFAQLLSAYQTRGIDAFRQFAVEQGVLTTQDEIRMTLALDSTDRNVVDDTTRAITRFGGRVTMGYDDRLELVAPVAAIVRYAKQGNQRGFFSDLTAFQHLRNIHRTPLADPRVPFGLASTETGVTRAARGGTSEGVVTTGADIWQKAGITGKGVKVGILDQAFNSYQSILADAKVTTRSFRSDGLIEDPEDTESIHGTACAEIAHEMAPDAELYLATQQTPGEFAKALDWLVSVGVQVVSNSTGWDGTYPIDGTSRQARAVDAARDKGVLYFAAAGNSASGQFGSDSGEGHYAAIFHDGDGDGFHDFPDGANPGALAVQTFGKPLRIVLNWGDFQYPRVNYDLFLTDAAGTVVASSKNNQSLGYFDPIEIIRGKPARGKYYLKVQKKKASDPDLPFHLFFYGAQFERITPPYSLTVPADARGAIAVAAFDVRASAVEVFSSEGPTFDRRAKPEISAPDETLSRAYATIGYNRFAGTSAATPHMAGAAALFTQAFPTASRDDMLRYFAKHAKKPDGAAHGENITGAGLLYLDVAPDGASRAPAPARPGTSKISVAQPGR